jgi:hypothetical protein
VVFLFSQNQRESRDVAKFAQKCGGSYFYIGCNKLKGSKKDLPSFGENSLLSYLYKLAIET